MRNDILDILKEDHSVKITLIFIILFPVILLVGSAVVNISIILMNIFFLVHIFSEKKYSIFNNDIFYVLSAFWLFLIINTLLNDGFKDNYLRGFGFIRFILFIFSISYFLSYKKFKFKKAIFNVWTVVYIIVSLDLIFEFIYGFNSLGFKNIHDGRLSGFTGDELVIGHWYFCFSLIILSNNFKQSKIFYFLLFLSIVVSFLIGERANFIRLFLAIIFLLIITNKVTLKSLGVLVLTIASIIFITENSKNIVAGNEFKSRYYNEVVNLIKQDSFKKLNNINSYTPMYINAYVLFKENKTLGVGLGSYYKKSHKIFAKYKKTFAGFRMIPNTHPHQYHFEIWATLGLPGYIFIFSMIFYFIIKSFFYYKLSKNIINLSSLLMIFVFLFHFYQLGVFFLHMVRQYFG